MIYVDGTGRRLRLGRELARGGEGAVFSVEGDARQVAKLYLRPLTDEKRRKLAWMADNGTRDLLEQTAWPRATLHRAPGLPPLGFLMPRLSGWKPVHLLYSPASRTSEFPDRDWGFLLAVAANIACAFEAVHAAGHLVGDVNERNVLVSPSNGTVRLIDCDSFQVLSRQALYPCEVGVARFTAPELQNRHLRLQRTEHHDGFGLAVLLFHLIYLGRHPFDGVFLGQGEMTSERAIAEHRFAYGRDAAAREMRPPPIHLPFRTAPPELTELFERAFSPASSRAGRPGAAEWSLALRSAAGNLRQCGADRMHVFPGHLLACPFCQLTASTGAVYFVAVDSLDFQSDPSDVAPLVSFARETQSRFFLAPPPAAAQMTNEPMPQPLEAELARLRLASRARFAAGLLVLACWNVFLFGPQRLGVVLLALTAAALCGLHLLVRKAKNRSRALRLLSERTAAVAEAAESLERAQQDSLKSAWTAAGRFKHHLAGIEALRAEYESLQGRFAAERKGLEGRTEELQRNENLRRIFLARAEVPGLGTGVKQALRSFGIETAYDVLHAMPDDIRGLGEARRGRLLDWARAAQRRFRFDPKSAMPPHEIRALVTKYRKEQVSLKARLEDACGKLRRAASEMAADSAAARARVAQAESALSQARGILPVSDEIARQRLRRRPYERGFTWGAIAAACAASGLYFAVPGSKGGAGREAEAALVPPHGSPEGSLAADCVLRAGPQAGSASIEELPRGTALIVESRNDDGWRRVRTPAQEVGWTSPSCWAR